VGAPSGVIGMVTSIGLGGIGASAILAGTTVVVDIMASWFSWSSRMLPKVGCSDPSAMVDKV
jgi:hypothetical protein